MTIKNMQLLGGVSGDFSFRHYIITRYNLDINGRPDLAPNSQCLEASWLEDRLQLFRSICVPSVASQTSKNFTWLILIHPKTPAEYVGRVKRGLKICANNCVIWQGDSDWFAGRDATWRTFLNSD